MKLAKIIKRFRIDKPDKFRLADVDPADTCGLDIEKAEAKALLADGVERLAGLAGKALRAEPLVGARGVPGDGRGRQGRRDQARDVRRQSAGLPGACLQGAERARSSITISSGASPRRCPSAGASASSTARTTRKCWWCACIPEILARQRLPDELIGKDIWDERFKSIRDFERHLARNGTLVLKFFLHVSKEEQRQRFLARLDEPGKRWKFEMGDVAERKLWDKYMHAYEDAIRHTSRPEAPWYVVPADNKWFARLVIAEAMVEAMESLELRISQGRRRGAEGTAEGAPRLLAEAPKRK